MAAEKAPKTALLTRMRTAFDAFAQNYPARFAITAFAGLNLLFAALFMTPWASASGETTNFFDALFTGVSVVSVTGLTVVDMTVHWSPFGDFLTLLGVQLGGIGVLTLTSFLGMIVARRLGLRQRLMAAGESNPGRMRRGAVAESQAVRLGDMSSLLKLVIVSVLVFEAALVLLLLPRLLLAGKPFGDALYESVYWSFTAFTNSGFAPTSAGVAEFGTDPYFLGVLMLGVFIGSLGFPVYFVLLRNLGNPRHWSLHVKLTISVSAILFLAGAATYFGLEFGHSNSWGDADAGQQALQALFMSAMTRSGGFATFDPSQLHQSSMLVTNMLMFVGGGSASTAGGIKVTTLAVLFLAAIAEARGREQMEAFGRAIPLDILRLSVAVTLWSATIVAFVTIVLLQLTDQPLSIVLFDVISAFATCGLTAGFVNADLPAAAKAILAVTMLVGRIGGVTLAAALAARQKPRLFNRPAERPLVG